MVMHELVAVVKRSSVKTVFFKKIRKVSRKIPVSFEETKANTNAYWEPCQTSEVERLAKIVNC